MLKRSWLLRYGIPILAVALTLLVKLLLNPLLEVTNPFLLFFAAIMISAWYGGNWAGLVATGLAALASSYFFLPPIYSVFSKTLGQNLPLVLFVLEGSLISWVVAALRFAKWQAEASTQEALQHRETVRMANQEMIDILESITEAFVACDRQWRFAYVNQESTRLLQKSREELLGKEIWREVFTSCAGDRTEQELRRAVAEQVTVELETFVAELGLWLEIRAYPSPSGLSVYFRDITELKQTQAIHELNEMRLQEHQRLLQQVADAAPGVIYVYDLEEQRNIYINRQVVDVLGYTPEQIQAMGSMLFQRLVHPDDLANLPEHTHQFDSLQDGECVESEYRMQRANGEWRWLRSRDAVFSKAADGSPRQILGTAYDVTERKRAEAALRHETERFELAAHAVDCLIYDWNVATNAVERTEGLTRIFGYSLEEAAPTSAWWRERIHPDDIEAALAQFNKSLAIADRYEIEYRVRNKHDQYLYVLDQGFVVRDGEGQPTRIVGATIDISDRKATERLQQFLLELNDTVRMLSDPQDILWAVVSKVGTYFNVSRCLYGEVDTEQAYVTIYRDFCNEVASVVGRRSINDFGPIVPKLKQGMTLAIDDVQANPHTLPYQAAFAAIQTRAVLCVPIVEQERFVALMILHHHQPRSWAAEEIALMEEVAERTWLAIEKARAEKALRQSEARFQRLATNVPGAICRYIVYPDGSEAMPYISPSCRTLFELEPETIQQDINALWRLIHTEDRTSLQDIIAISAKTEQPLHWEGRFVLSADCTKWIQIVSRPEQLIDGSVLWDGILTDITGIKEVEAERERLLVQSQHYANQLRGLTEAALVINSSLSSEELLQTVTEQAHLIIGTHQATTNLVINQNWAEAVHAMYLSEKYAEWLNYSAEPDGSGIYACVCHLNRPMRMTQAELESHPKWRGFGKEAGKHPPLHGWLAAPLTGQHGENIGLIQLSDKYEGEFTALDEDILVQLAQMASVAFQNMQLYQAEQTARTQAESANRIKDEFLAVLSHELRSPLNPIMGWSKLMRSRNLDQRTTTYALETIERNAKLQTQLIEDLLDVSRILQGKLSLNICSVDLVSTVHSAMETVRLAAEAKEIDLRFTIYDCRSKDNKEQETREPAQLPNLQPPISTNSKFQVLGDPNRLQQVVWNLLANAVKFTPTGGRIDLRLEQVGNGEWGMGNGEMPSHSPLPTPHSPTYAQIIVTDDGKGIEPKFLPHIFDYFRQEDGATTRKFGGLGLGLAIVRHIVELHGGTVQAASSGEGKGSTFTVRLPLMKDEGGKMKAESDLHPSSFILHPLQDIRVLLADDEADSRELLLFVLRQAGATVTAVVSAKDALQKLAESDVDVLISDIGMPEMDGYMLMRQIRSQVSNKNHQVLAIALTAYAGELNQRQALKAGFQKHLSKPIEPAELIMTIANLVERKELGR